AAWMYCPSQVSRCVQYTFVRYPPGESDGMPNVDESNHSHSFLTMTTRLPLEEGELGLPRLTGMTVRTWSFFVTVLVLDALSTFMTSLSPMVACTVTSAAPYAPPPSGSPPTASRIDSFVPLCQYSRGRKWISRALNQFQAPSCAGSLVTNSRRSTFACWSFGTSALKLTTSGIPTPYVRSSPTWLTALTKVDGFAIVVNVALFAGLSPAFTITAYFVAYLS